MEYYATIKHHSMSTTWEKLTAGSLASAKREATKEYGGGYIGHIIHLVEVYDGFDSDLNDVPAWTKEIGPDKWMPPVD